MARANQSHIKNTVGSTQFGTSLRDLGDGDLDRGFSNANADPEAYEERNERTNDTPFDPNPNPQWEKRWDHDRRKDDMPRIDGGFLYRPPEKTEVL